MGSQVNKKKRERKKEEEEKRRKREQKKDIEQVKQTERQVFLYKAYYAKH